MFVQNWDSELPLKDPPQFMGCLLHVFVPVFIFYIIVRYYFVLCFFWDFCRFNGIQFFYTAYNVQYNVLCTCTLIKSKNSCQK